ncbi:AAA domain-containing protein [Shewanella sp. KCT]|uniref:AAA domain-containing protein n=1 Tax=Shewanella sp. KCT TaxID=2569535 RepID=UPI00118282BC|nr:AAA domain-containing protein [Shewanella sp. KCT]TVP12287.1 hypothetical protein AYI87_14755 [Shewanella sp. KCT]
MVNPFFTALEQNLAFEDLELAEQTSKVLTPFKHYLDNSIKALENKEVSCEWRPIANTRYKLTPDKRIWQLLPVSKIEIDVGQVGWYEVLYVDGERPNGDFNPDEAAPIYQGKGKGRIELTVPENGYRPTPDFQLYLPNLQINDDQISWCGYQLELRPLAIQMHDIRTVHVDGFEFKVRLQRENQLSVEGHVTPNSNLSIDGKNTAFIVIESLNDSMLSKWHARRNGSDWLLFSTKRPDIQKHELKDVTAQQLSKLSCAHFEYQNVGLALEQWSMRADSQQLILESIGTSELNQVDKLTCPSFPELAWSLESSKVEEKWIQLYEKEGSDDSGKSDLDYFFDDTQNVKILDPTQRKNDDGYRVISARTEERQLLLAVNTRGKKSFKSVYPSEKGKLREIRVSVDTSQLKRQKDAINSLMRRPASGHWPLIHLLQDRAKANWADVPPVQESTISWKVLTDPKFDGCDRQREFVAKALANKDFTILDGPPGTGKTTTILELIIQLVIQGKRVLLSASTHAAINNVLERVKENATLSEHIFPLRIGDKGKATGVEEFQFDELLKELQGQSGCERLSKQLMVDSSNLVCGTTIGILSLFNDRDVMLDRGDPPFDVMIIDECSKTTFQEFLVPARFAKRWVLVGDIRQLSPFTDREQIVANLDNLMLEPPRKNFDGTYLSGAVQQACWLLDELRGGIHNDTTYAQPMLLPVSHVVLAALLAEINSRRVSKQYAQGLENILLISDRLKQNDRQLVNVESLKQAPWHMYSCGLCFVDEVVVNEIQYLLPADAVLLHPAWMRTSHAAAHRVSGTNARPFKIKNNEYKETAHINRELLDRLDSTKWSEEVCWRLEREYWLRLSSNDRLRNRYIKTLNRLFPKSVNADGRIHVLKNIAFPSILEALSGDGLVKRKNDEPTTLNQGFGAIEKAGRHTTLTYQHRMHPDISKFPRQQFYPKGVLADGSKTTADRMWDFSRYSSRNMWIDVPGQAPQGNSRKEEVQVLITELKAFCDWASGKSKNRKGEPFDIAILTFYKGQEKALREALKKLPDNKDRYARFQYKGISIKLATVDYFQGQEADVVMLSMVNTNRDGFMDSPNRLNVSITRARYQLVIVGHYEYFSSKTRTDELKNLATSCQVIHSNRGSRSSKGEQKRNSKND